jgi:hypothetical protein
MEKGGFTIKLGTMMKVLEHLYYYCEVKKEDEISFNIKKEDLDKHELQDILTINADKMRPKYSGATELHNFTTNVEVFPNCDGRPPRIMTAEIRELTDLT